MKKGFGFHGIVTQIFAAYDAEYCIMYRMMD